MLPLERDFCFVLFCILVGRRRRCVILILFLPTRLQARYLVVMMFDFPSSYFIQKHTLAPLMKSVMHRVIEKFASMVELLTRFIKCRGRYP